MSVGGSKGKGFGPCAERHSPPYTSPAEPAVGVVSPRTSDQADYANRHTIKRTNHPAEAPFASPTSSHDCATSTRPIPCAAASPCSCKRVRSMCSMTSNRLASSPSVRRTRIAKIGRSVEGCVGVKLLAHEEPAAVAQVAKVCNDAGNVDVCREQIRRGMAWACRQHIRDGRLLNDEEEARSARRGLWSDSNPFSRGGGGKHGGIRSRSASDTRHRTP